MDATELLTGPEAQELQSAQARLKNKAGDGAPTARRATAESMATKQRDISVSEFFAKNRHLLGFDSPRKALLTAVKEAVDNSLDACEEAGILPDITVVIEDLQPDRPSTAKSSRYRISVVDNGPGIVRKQVENVFGRLLYGSKFHRLKMSRGQQGIGISAAGMYGLITTGKPMLIQSRTNAGKQASHIELAMNTKTNRAEVTVDEETDDFPLARLRELSPAVRDLSERGEFLSLKDYPTGTSVSIEMEGKYQRGRGSIDEFLDLTAIANPHAKITLVRPTRVTEDEEDAPLLKRGSRQQAAGSSEDQAATAGSPNAQSPMPAALPTATTQDLGDLVVFPRAVTVLPPETKEIQPHPRGIELGILLQMLKEAEAEKPGYTLYNFLQDKFSRVSTATASQLCESIKFSSRGKVADVDHAQAEKLFKALQDSKLPPPPTDCLAPIGVQQLLKGMFKGVRAEFYAASSREPAIYRGRPFLIEAAIAFGGELAGDDSARVIRFANRVPLLYQQSACSSFKAVVETNWRNYDLQQPRGGIPVGALCIMIHMASVWVPFTSESKEAIADYDEIRKEMKLALMECGRKLGTYLRKRAKMERESQRRDIFERYIGEITQAVSAINGTEAKTLYDALLTQAKKRTAIADLELDEEGKALEDPADQDGVIIVDSAATGSGISGGTASVSERDAEPEVNTSSLKKKRKGKSDDDDTPTLIADEPQAKGKGDKGSKAATPVKGKGEKPAKASKSPSPAAQERSKPAASAPATASTPTKAAKPKMRLNPKTGKLEPIDDGLRLF